MNIRIALYLLAGITLAGCMAHTPSPHYFLLNPLNPEPVLADSRKTRVVTLSAVHIPHYADRPQIVTSGTDNQYQLDDYNRWAERLDDNILRVLQQNLSTLLPDTVILQNDSRPNLADTLRLSVDILDILADSTGTARLVTQWTLARHHQIVETRQSSHQVHYPSETAPARVAAINELINRLSHDIAEDLKTN
ncbi:MAG: PqiC family protein [Methylococcaceae bacterium]